MGKGEDKGRYEKSEDDRCKEERGRCEGEDEGWGEMKRGERMVLSLGRSFLHPSSSIPSTSLHCLLHHLPFLLHYFPSSLRFPIVIFFLFLSTSPLLFSLLFSSSFPFYFPPPPLPFSFIFHFFLTWFSSLILFLPFPSSLLHLLLPPSQYFTSGSS